jgi:hypothetical protein
MDIAALNNQIRLRESAPFATAAAGARASGVAQKRALPGPGTIAGSGGTWTQAGPSPLCDGHTLDSTLCPLTDNTVIAPQTPSNGDYSLALLGHKTLSGRITAFAADPANASRVFAAPAVGGIFETVDGGATWHSIADVLPTQAMGAVAYDAPLHRVFAGTGDNSFGGDAISGVGIFYSDDDGGTWFPSTSTNNALLDSEIFRIVPDPSNNTGQVVFAATSRGLFRSANGGATWVNTNLPTSPAGYTVPDPTQGNAQVPCTGNTSAPLCFFANIVTDVVVKATASENAPAGSVMAVVGWRAGNRANTNPNGSTNTSCKQGAAATACLQAPRNGLYESNTGAPGSFAFKTHSGGPTDFAADANVGRTTLGIADGAGQNNDAVFALVQDAEKFQHCLTDPFVSTVQVCSGDAVSLGAATVLDGAYATYDFGASWTKIMDFSQLHFASGALTGIPGYSPGVQSWYNNWIKPDPTVKDGNGNPTRLLFGLEEIWENNLAAAVNPLSTPWVAQGPANGPTAPWRDIGRYWNDCGGLNQTAGLQCDLSGNPGPPGGTTTHPDQHGFLFVPDPTGGGVTFFAGNDGGAYKQHVAAAADFSNAEWHDGINTGLYTLQPYDAGIAKDGTIVAGLQDNGEMKIAPNGAEAHTIFGGDGFMTTIDPGNSQNIIEEYTYGAVNMSQNGGRDWWAITPGACNSSEAQFSTAIEQDPTKPGHVLVGCTQIQEGGGGAGGVASVYDSPCTVPPGASWATCGLNGSPFVTVFDLGTADAPGVPADRNVNCNINNCVFNVPSALGVRGENQYVGYCGYCDIVTGGVPFASGIATNVGGGSAGSAQIGSTSGWHIASIQCSNCGTANGKLPQRYITSVQLDPADPNTVYVTEGGYGRRWIPPGSLGDDVTNVGRGHIFVSHDHAEHFTDISGDPDAGGLPDIPANWSLIHGNQLVVATDAGVFTSADTNGNSWGVLGTGLPNAPVFTIRLQPGNPDRMIAATYGRGVQQYNFNSGSNPVSTNPTSGGGVTVLPNTAALAPYSPLVPTGLAVGVATGLLWRRRRTAARNP